MCVWIARGCGRELCDKSFRSGDKETRTEIKRARYWSGAQAASQTKAMTSHRAIQKPGHYNIHYEDTSVTEVVGHYCHRWRSLQWSGDHIQPTKAAPRRQDGVVLWCEAVCRVDDGPRRQCSMGRIARNSRYATRKWTVQWRSCDNPTKRRIVYDTAYKHAVSTDGLLN